MIRRTLSEDLAARLPAGTVVPPQAPAPPATRGLVIDVQEFLPEANGQVVLRAAWTVLAPPDTQQNSAQQNGAGAPTAGSAQGGDSIPDGGGSRRWQIQAGAGADAQVAAMSRLLGHLAGAIAMQLGAQRAGPHRAGPH